MILGGNHELECAAGADRTTLDALFRRAGVRNADAVALADPPNRDSVTGGAPRRLTYAQADRAISAMAAKLRQLGLPTDAVVAMQLPNTVESIIALLGVLRAGMIAAPLPLLWRRQDIVAALKAVSVKAIVTVGRIGSIAHADIAMQAAAELFPVRYVCGFGSGLPDGVVPLDDVFGTGLQEFMTPPLRPANPADHVAVYTFDTAYGGGVRHSHAELIAAGRNVHLASGAAQDTAMLSPVPLASFAGLAVTLLSWMLGGGTLNLHHAFDPEVFAAQARTLDSGTIVLPGPALGAMAEADLLGDPAGIIALWRSPEHKADPYLGGARLTDVVCVTENDVVVGPMTGSPSAGIIGVGGYGLRQTAVEFAVAAIDANATIVALPDAVLGQRLAGSASNPGALVRELQARGVNPLIAGAFAPRNAA